MRRKILFTVAALAFPTLASAQDGKQMVSDFIDQNAMRTAISLKRSGTSPNWGTWRNRVQPSSK